MSESWKLSAYASKPVIQAALLAHEEIDDWDPEVVISGREISEDRPDEWVLEAWYPSEPDAAQKLVISNLFGNVAPIFELEKLPDEDWLTLSQQGVDPIRAGRFYVHTPDHPPVEDAINFAIPASQAFGTGQHETTAGCLAMLDIMKRTGLVARNIADIGTGTGLLAFAAIHLWKGAFATASDIDDVCAGVVADNATLNKVTMGADRGELTMVIADGMEDELLQARGPYDLLIANILAGPLVELAPDFAASITPGGSVLLAGLLENQEARVRSAYSRAGFRLAQRMVNGDWSILWLRKRRI
ncbi:50S ribosomal protein L11 methyltransferase [Altererythrobacter sp.]|uniref:50S ribosomal protein L11 methyltransferase n=1 Tax=Altererythrobacter sp. TaxID=1872480 RepID=UPI001B29B983|nr:50S ribosomal protein L11 methyltransferase [Altererythrobacter sp.]MBO6608170.1 50S ribosomal protein L11 methyltransferase [Altererythrobacter sp.]MBO6641574.1 50S ribosomal protein L11 methyltransferase [Altererythrobacter sp.]MBO6707727.1 50S ribosomal protein L11 methyltransferase [Altererythrobacter sp.]